MKKKSQSFSINMHGALLRLYSNNTEYIDYLQAHFDIPQQKESFCTVEVYLDWTEEIYKTSKPYQFKHLDKLTRIGRRIWIGENELVWNEVIKGLKLQFNYNNNTQIHAYHDLILSKHLLKRIYKQIIRKRAFEEVKKDIYEGLTYYLIYYPILYALESKNIYILHGSAVTYNDKAILMPGLPGVGKSTLCMALLSNKNSKFLSDNIVLYDDNKIYACFEPIRLDENSISLMPDKGQKIINMHIESCYSRGSYKVKENETLQQISPDILIIPCRAGTSSVVEITQERAVQLCMDFNKIAGETNSFLTYSSIQNMYYQNSNAEVERVNTLLSLTKKMKCYLLSVENNTSLDRVIKLVDKEILGIS